MQLPFMVGTAADGTARVVRLGQVAEVVDGTGPNQINRRNLNREVAINANVFGRSAGEVSAEIRQVLDSTPFPPGYRYEFGGSTKNMQESFGYAISALALAIIFIYMILASQFQSFLQPLALMTRAAAHADRRGADAADVRLHHEHVLGHRHRAAHGPGHEKRHPAGGLCDPRPQRPGGRGADGPRSRPCCWPPACGCAPSS